MLARMRTMSSCILSLSVLFLLSAGCKKSAEGAPVPKAAAPKPSLDKPQTLNERADDVYKAKFATS